MTCAIKECIECGKPTVGRGLCRRHYNQLWAKQNPERSKEITQKSQKKHYSKRKQYFRKWKAENPDRWEALWKTNNAKLALEKRLWAYNLSVEEYREILDRASKQCAICGFSFEQPTRDEHIDHCHETGLIRGLLCRHCNYMLGYAKDSLLLLQKAAEYLQSPPVPQFMIKHYRKKPRNEAP